MRDAWLTDWMPSERFPVYTRANAGEVMAAPCSPLGWTLVWEQAMVPGWRDVYLRHGLLSEQELPEHQPPVCGSFGGYFYVNLSCNQTWAARLLGSKAEVVDTALIAEQRGRADAARRSRTDLTYLNPAELLERARELLPLLRETFAGYIAAGLGDGDSADAALALWDLSRTVANSADLKLYFDGGVPGILERFEGSPSDDAKAFLDDLDTFLYEYGSCGPGQWDIRADVWETNPALVLDQLAQLRLVPDSAERAEATAEVAERARVNASKVTNEIRIVIREIGRQMADANHIADQDLIMMLTADELDDFVAHPENYGLKLAERAREHAALADLEPPILINGVVPPLSAWPDAR
jgi:pyruvate,water dikinase